jgi:hypothetical protein
MVQEDLDYIDKQECERRGFVKGTDGKYYKLNSLERLGRDGYLDFGNPRYSALDRVSAGNRLWRDFYRSRVESSGVNDLTKVRVDGGGGQQMSQSVLEARDRFNKAIRMLPQEFIGVVTRVCCDDKELVLAEKSERKRTQEKHRQAMVLCLGLDRLVEHYRR